MEKHINTCTATQLHGNFRTPVNCNQNTMLLRMPRSLQISPSHERNRNSIFTSSAVGCR